MFTEDQRQRIVELFDAFCEGRVPIMARDQIALQYTIERHDVVLFEKRPVFNQPGKWVNCNVAKFRWNASRDTWSLLWRDRDSLWHHYDAGAPSDRLEVQLDEVDRDPTGIFWG